MRTWGKKSNFGEALLLPAFVFIILIFGGGSRDDIISLVALRPLTALALFYGIYRIKKQGLVEMRSPLLFFCCWAALISLQLLPLPPSLWTALPGRTTIAESYKAAHIAIGWMPLTVVPSETLNALGASLVPIAIVLLYGTSNDISRQHALRAISIFAIASAILGIMQIIGGGNHSLYPFTITNFGAPVGFFANRNHQAATLAATIPLIVTQSEFIGSSINRRSFVRLSWLIVTLFVLIAAMTGSRTGALLAIISFALTLLTSRKDFQYITSIRKLAPVFKRMVSIVVVMAIVIFILILLKSNAFDRFANKDEFSDLRFVILPDVLRMTRDAFPVGWGFGTFPQVYQSYEQVNNIIPQYINRAHNDILEVVAEGGVAVIALLMFPILWFIRLLWNNRDIFFRAVRLSDRMAFSAALGIILFVCASLTDYPIRTPSVTTIMTVFFCYVAEWNRRRTLA